MRRIVADPGLVSLTGSAAGGLIVVVGALFGASGWLAFALGMPGMASLLLAFRCCRRGGRQARAAVVVSSLALTAWAVECAVLDVVSYWRVAGNA